MNILFITNTLPPKVDGVGDYTYNISKEFARNGHSVSIICRKDDGINTLVEEEINIFAIIERWDGSARTSISQIIESEKIELVSLQYVPHGFHPKGLPFGLVKVIKGIKRLGVPIFTFAHEVYVKPEKWNVKRTVVSLLMQYISKQIIGNSKFVATSISHYRDMIKGLLSNRNDINIIPIASNVPHLDIQSDKLSELRKRVAEDDQLIVSFFGLRDIAGSIAAIEQLRSNGVKIKIMLIGKLPSSLPETLPSDIYKTGILDIEDIDQYLQVSDILILPENPIYGVSFKSGSLAAAMQCGLPVVTAKGIMSDAILRDGENIVFAEFEDVGNIAHKLEQLMNIDLRTKIGNGARTIASSHSWEETYCRYIKIVK